MLPDAMVKAVRAYQDLVKNPVNQPANTPLPERDHKACQVHQAACKSALQHIEILMKLAAASSSQKTKSGQAGIADLMAKADHELKAYHATTMDNDEEIPS